MPGNDNFEIQILREEPVHSSRDNATPDITILGEEAVDPPLLNPDLYDGIEAYFRSLDLRPGQYRGDVPASISEFRSQLAPFCVSESFYNALLASGWQMSQVRAMLQLPSGASDNDIVSYLHRDVAGQDPNKFLRFTSAQGKDDQVGRIVQRLTEANLIKRSFVQNGAGIDPLGIFREMLENGSKGVIIDGGASHATALVGEEVGWSGHTSPHDAAFLTVDPLDDTTVSEVTLRRGQVLDSVSRGSAGRPTYLPKSLGSFIRDAKESLKAARYDPTQMKTAIIFNSHK